VESGIFYLPLYPDEDGVVWNEAFLNSSDNALARLIPECSALENVVRVIDVRAVTGGRLLQVIMDGDEDRALAFLAPPS